jgi:hypothetical protein
MAAWAHGLGRMAVFSGDYLNFTSAVPLPAREHRVCRYRLRRLLAHAIERKQRLSLGITVCSAGTGAVTSISQPLLRVPLVTVSVGRLAMGA